MTDIHEFIVVLGETDRQPIGLIERIVRRLGYEKAGELLDATRAVEEQGGMLTRDSARRRTAGGVFFELTKQYLRDHDRRDDLQELFPPPQRRKTGDARKPTRAALAAAPVSTVAADMVAAAATGATLRPRMRGKATALPPPPRPASPLSIEPPVIPVAAVVPPAESAARSDINTALVATRRVFDAASGCYAVGAHPTRGVIHIKFTFPDVARVTHAAALVALAEETGWQIDLHPEPHQERLADAARALAPAGIAIEPRVSLRHQTRQAVVRYRGAWEPAAIAAAQHTFLTQTGWQLHAVAAE